MLNLRVSAHIRRAIIGWCVLLLSGCGAGSEAPSEPAPTVTTVSVEPGELVLRLPAGTGTLAATVRDQRQQPLAGRTVAWSSSNAAIATVNGSGVVTAVAVGVATISATSEGRSGSAMVSVLPPAVAAVTIAPTDLTLVEETARSLEITVVDATGATVTGRATSWSSSAPAVASVSATGVVTALTAGTATISADVEGVRGTALVTVTPVPVASLTIARDYLGVVVGGSDTVTVEARSASGRLLSGRTYTWTSSDESVARASAVGTITGVRGGAAVIVASIDGRSTAPLRVAVGGGSQDAGWALALAGSHSCMRSLVGAAWCWGLNLNGRLGFPPINVMNQNTQPTPREVPAPTSWARLAAGENHTCALNGAGLAWCWGLGGAGALGNGMTQLRTAPTVVSGGVAFESLDGGRAHSCGLARDGRVWCWGASAFGQIGDGQQIGRTTPTAAAGASPWIAVSAGAEHTCALAADGAIWCWGRNQSGQLGDGTKTNRAVPTAVSTSQRFVSLTAGLDHTCAITAAGAAWCWGNNGDGALGTGEATASDVPVAVSGTRRFAAVSAGYGFTCALDRDGAAWCWGRGDIGTNGDGTTQRRLAPVTVAGGRRFMALATGDVHACAVAIDGTGYCWGRNDFSVLGDDSLADRLAPVPVATMVRFGTDWR